MKHKVYSIVMGLELTAIGIKYEGSDTNPFKQLIPTTLLFYTAAFCHALAFTTDINLPITIIIFHVSGLLGCEALFWILVAELLWYYVINLLLLLVGSLCFFNHIADIIHLLCDVGHVPNMQPQEPQQVLKEHQNMSLFAPVEESTTISHLSFDIKYSPLTYHPFGD